MIRTIGLQNNAARIVPPTRSARHLQQGLTGSFRRSKILQMQQSIRRHNAHQRHLRQIQALRQHLSSHQQIGISTGKPIEQTAVRPLRPSRVTIKSQKLQLGEFLRKLLRHPLRPTAKMLEVNGTTHRTNFRLKLRIATIMTAQQFRRCRVRVVIRQRNIAIWTFHHITTTPTRYMATMSPSMDKQNSLIALLLHLSNLIPQRSAENRSIPFL